MPKDILSHWSLLQRKMAGIACDEKGPHGVAYWTPNADLFEGPNGSVVKMDLAGVHPSSLAISLQAGALIVEGVRRDPYSGETAAGYRFRQMEIEYGPFRKVFPIAHPVDADGARATYLNGILEIRLPRARQRRRRTLTIIVSS